MASSYQVNFGSNDDPVKSYIERIEKNYEDALVWISKIEQDASQILHDETEINAKTKHIDHHAIDTGGVVETYTTWRWTNKYSTWQRYQLQNEVNNLNADIQEIANSKLDPIDAGLQNLSDTIVGLLQGVESTLTQDIGKNVAEDAQKVLNYVHQLCQAMKQQAKADECAALCEEEFAHGGSDLKLIQQWATAMREALFAEGSTLNSLSSMITNDLNALLKQNDQAQAGLKNLFLGEATQLDNTATINNYKDMLTLLTGVLNHLNPLVSSLSNSDFDQLSQMLDMFKKKIAQILADTSLNPAAKQKQILAIFMLVMSILGLVQQFAAKDKAQNEQTMSKASIEAARANIQNTTMEQTEFSNALHAQAVMGVLMKVFQILMGIAMTILAPGIGSAICMTIATVLDASGVFDKIAQAISKGTDGQAGIGGEIAVSAMEMVFTLGGGAVLDVALKVAMKAAMEAVATALKTTMEAVADKAAKEAVTAGDQAVEKAAQDAMQQVVQSAVKSAAEKMFIQYFKQNIGSLLVDAVKNGGVIKGFIKMAQKSMQQAAKETIDTAAEDATKFMAQNGIEKLTTEEGVRIAEKAADVAIAKLTNSTADKVAKEAVQSNWWKTALRRALFTAIYATGTNNIIVDTIGAAAKKKMSDENYQKLLVVLQVLQQLMVMIAQFVGSGSFSQVVLEGSSTVLMRMSRFLQTLGLGGDFIANTGNAVIDMKEAAVIQEIAKTQGAADIINYLESEIVKRQKQEASRDGQEQIQIVESSAQLAEGLFKYYNASSQALAAAAV